MKVITTGSRKSWLVLIPFLLFNVVAVFASPVNQGTASLVAKAFVNSEKSRWQENPKATPALFGTKGVAAAVQSYSIADIKEVNTDDGSTVAYVAELNPEGFVIISANDEVKPVLGFSFQGQFPFTQSGRNALLHLIKWDMTGRLNMLKNIKAKGIAGTFIKHATQEWNNYLSISSSPILTPIPLTIQQWPSNQDGWITNQWNQNSPFNGACPKSPAIAADPNLWYLGGRCAVGCVATAFAQIVDYWKYPQYVSFSTNDSYISKGTAGNISIDVDSSTRGFPSFGQLNNILTNITYDGSNLEKSNLCFAAGIKLRMQYGTESGAYESADAYLNGFSYGSARLAENNAWNLWNVWASKESSVINNIKESWPVQIGISTYPSGSHLLGQGHSVIVDGYRTDGYFHINLGWGVGRTLAWYALPSMNTTNLGDLAGHYDFEWITRIVYDIAPYRGWSQVGADVSNSFRTVYTGPTSALNKWSTSDTSMPNGSVISGLVVGNGNRIYAAVNPPDASSYPDIFMIDRYGTKSRITIPDRGYTLSNPALMSDGTVCAIGSYTWSSSYPNIYLYKINPNTLQLTRTQILSIAQANLGALRIDGQNILYFADTQHLYCFSPSGSQMWPAFTFPHSAELINDTKAPAVDVSRNKIYVTYYDVNSNTAYLGCVNRSTGQLLQEVPFSNVPLNRVSVPSIGIDGTVYVGVGTKLYALNPDSNLSSKWGPIDPSGGTGFINQPPAIGSDGTLYLAYWKTIGGSDYIAFGAFNSQNGVNTWEVHVTPSGDYDIGSRGYVAQGGTVYFWRYVHNGVSQLYAYQDNGNSATALFNQSYAGAQIAGFGPGGTMYVTSGATINAVAGGAIGDPDGAGMGFADNQPPNQPTLVAPADESTGLSSNSVMLSWQCTDPVGHNLSYDLSVCALITNQEATFVPITNGLIGTSFTLTNLQPGVSYLWKVVASDGQAITESPVWAFTTQTNSGTNAYVSYLLQQPFDPSTQDIVLASGSGIHSQGEDSEAAEVFNDKIYYTISSDGSSTPSKIYCFDPVTASNTIVLSETNNQFLAVKIMEGELWVSHTDGRLWKSIDGVAFALVSGSPFSTTNFVTAMAEFSGQMYFATSGGNIYASADGSTFYLVTSIDSGYAIRDLVVWKGCLYGANQGLYGLPPGYSPLPDEPSLIFRTANGTNWTIVSTNDTYEFFGFVPTDNYLYLASMEDPNWASLAFRCTSDGTNWTRFFYTTSEGKGINGHPCYFSQTGRVYYLSSWNGVVEFFPIFNGTMETRIQAAHGFSSVVEVNGQLFGIGSMDPANWQSSPFVVSLLGNYTIAGSGIIPLLGFGSTEPLTTNGFTLMLRGQTGSNYVIEASSNLLNWIPLTNFILSNPPMFFSDPSATNYKQRFYRAVSP